MSDFATLASDEPLYRQEEEEERAGVLADCWNSSRSNCCD
jgi:hypothetical protein